MVSMSFESFTQRAILAVFFELLSFEITITSRSHVKDQSHSNQH